MKSIPDAIRELRKALGEKFTQQDLAVKLGMAVSSISHYEIGDRKPDGPSALLLHRAAQEANRQDLADVFLAIINDAMGHLIAPISSADDHLKVRALLLTMKDPRFKRSRRALEKALAPAENHLREEQSRKARDSKKLFENFDALVAKRKGETK
jgi:transcriptional regulator with XRE-family HTH domain